MTWESVVPHHQCPPTEVLVAVVGLTPQVVTEALYYLTQEKEPPSRIQEILILTTQTGKERVRTALLDGTRGRFYEFCRDYGVDPRTIQFDERSIRVVCNETGAGLEDIRTERDHSLLAEQVVSLIRELTARDDTILQCSLAGGRKTMSFLLGYALSLFGRPHDRLFHVLVDPPELEGHEEFYFKPKTDRVLRVRGKEIHTRDARILDETLSKVKEVEHDEMDRLRGLEGGAAATYFGAFVRLFPPSLGFTGRSRRPPLDPVNALLSLSYTLLFLEIVREIEVIGLDPVIGFYHQFEYGRESLACDLMEPHRPGVDWWVWGLFRDRTFTDRDFTTGEERPGVYMKKGARHRYYEQYEMWRRDIRPALVEEVESLARRIVDGQDPVSHPEPADDREAGRTLSLD